MLGIVALLSALVPSAAAEKPVREFLPASDFTISGSCPFDVGLHIVQNNAYAITFSDGATLITGALKIRVTNLSDPSKTLDLNIPGPGLYTFSEDGGLTIDAKGPWVFFYPGVLVYTTGHVIFSVSGAGVFSLAQQGGTMTDLCAVLA
jgi:hypothetical protein